MATINFTVEDHSIRVDNLIELAQGSNNFDTCAFTFDSSWDGFTLYAVMYQNPKNVFKLPLDAENTRKIRQEVLQKDGWVYIGARGEKEDTDKTIATSMVVRLPVRKGAVNGNETGQEMLDQSQYEYLLGKVNELNEKCESLTKKVEHSNGVKVVNSISEMADTSTIYVLSTDGHWYYYNGAMWTDGGEFTGATISSTQIQSAVEDYLEENSQTMGTLTINGQQYNGSEDVVVEVASSGGGGSSETAQEAQLATGTIVAETVAGTVIDTGVTLETLKQYKRFIFILKGASNVELQNTYLFFGGQQNGSIARSDSAGGYVYEYEWVNVEEGLLRCCNYWQGNPSLLRSVGSSCIVTRITGSFNNNNSGGSYPYLFDLSGQEDTETLKINNSAATTIDYEWEVRGMTV